jgi:hypothetical protein
MKREVVQDFLNLPGIVGVALIQGQSQPYFCGIHQALTTQQQEALSQGIQQVIATTPVGFEFFEFQFNQRRVYIYKLDQDVILLVLAGNHLVYSTYAATIEPLKAKLQEDVAAAIATFSRLASNAALTEQQPEAPSVAIASLENSRHAAALKSLNQLQSAPPPRSAVPAQPNPDQAVSLKEVLDAINQLNKFTTQYLGTTVVTNYWKSTRPAVAWLNSFQIERLAQMTFLPQVPSESLPTLTAEQHEWMQAWVTAFIERCSKVIRDFPRLVKQTALNDRQKFLLFPDKS